MPNTQRATEIPTIDVEMLVIETSGDSAVSYALDSASNIGVEPQIETQDAVKLIVKGRLKAQKGEVSTITGNKITIKDNVFIPELVKILQGGTIKYWQDAEKTQEATTPSEYGISSYTPPVAGSNDKGEVFTLHAYSAQYNAAGQIVQYERIDYPNCKGVPVALNSEDGVFRAPEYTINSAPNVGEAPYSIHYVPTLPVLGN